MDHYSEHIPSRPQLHQEDCRSSASLERTNNSHRVSTQRSCIPRWDKTHGENINIRTNLEHISAMAAAPLDATQGVLRA